MKIYDRNLTGANQADTARAAETQRSEHSSGSKATGSGSASGDRVELSGALGQLSQALSASGSSREAKVQALAAQYQSGNYQPDSAATSHAMVSEAVACGVS